MTKSTSEKALETVARPAIEPQPIPDFTIVKQVTFPLLKHAAGETHYVKIRSAIIVGKILEKSNIATAARIIRVENLRCPGIQYEYIVSAVLESELTAQYPDNTYVNKCFEIYKVQPDDGRGKRYATFSVIEILPRAKGS